jgi:hypothetical protein
MSLLEINYFLELKTEFKVKNFSFCVKMTNQIFLLEIAIFEVKK